MPSAAKQKGNAWEREVAKDLSEKGFVTTSSVNLINWARTGSLHWMTFGLA